MESVALSHGEDHDLTVASVLAPKGGSDEDELDAAAEGAGEDAAEDAPAEDTPAADGDE